MQTQLDPTELKYYQKVLIYVCLKGWPPKTERRKFASAGLIARSQAAQSRMRNDILRVVQRVFGQGSVMTVSVGPID